MPKKPKVQDDPNLEAMLAEDPSSESVAGSDSLSEKSDAEAEAEPVRAQRRIDGGPSDEDSTDANRPHTDAQSARSQTSLVRFSPSQAKARVTQHCN